MSANKQRSFVFGMATCFAQWTQSWEI